MQTLLIDDHPLIHQIIPALLRKAIGDHVMVQSAENLERICLQVEEITAQLKLFRFAGGASTGHDAMIAIRQVADNMQSMTEALPP